MSDPGYTGDSGRRRKPFRGEREKHSGAKANSDSGAIANSDSDGNANRIGISGAEVAESLGLDLTVYFFVDPTIEKNVLGRTGWLDRVRLGLEHHESEIYLNAHG